MSQKRKKNEKVFGIGKSVSTKGEHPSPYVLDLNRVMAEKAETEKTPVSPKALNLNPTSTPRPKIGVGRDKMSKLTFIRLYFSVRRNVKNLFSSLIHGPRKFFGDAVYAIRALPRLMKFLKFAMEDYKRILFFGLVAFIFILPLQTFSYYESLKSIQDKALGGAEAAYGSLMSGGAFAAEANFSAAAENFGHAAASFGQAEEEIGRINSVISDLLKNMPGGGKKIGAGEALLFSGEKIASAGQNILAALADFTVEDNDRSLTQKIKILRDHLVVVLPEVAASSDRLSGVSVSAVPENEQEVFIKLQDGLPLLVENVKKLISVSDLMVKFLGDETRERYLVVFQNPGELRPTGGFMGSLALVDIDRGKITNMEIPGGGSYDFQGSLKERIIAPEPLHLVNARWELQDANWFPDFPASAEKIKWFYEHGGGPTVDGVIVFNADLVAELLGVVGPVDMPEYGKIINKDNFVEEMQKAVEVEYDKKENKPKKIIADMAPRLIQKILESDPKQFGQILSIFVKALGEKNILLYSVYPEMEHEIKNLGWAGEVKSSADNSDYLMVVHSNIGGGKTDRVMSEEDHLEVNIAEDGYIKNKLVIKRTHNGVKGDLFTGVRNVDYLRVYVPAGSKLISAEGFESPPANLFEEPEPGYRADPDLKNNEGGALADEASGTRITSESGKTVFGNWVQVDPGEEATVTIEYLLPFKLSFSSESKGWWGNLLENFGWGETEKIFYQLLVQKQPGLKNNLTGRVSFPDNWQTDSVYGQWGKVQIGSADIAAEMSSDRFYSLGFTTD